MKRVFIAIGVVIGLLLIAAMIYIVQKPNYDAALEDYERMMRDAGVR